jgi:hypothetical protein
MSTQTEAEVPQISVAELDRRVRSFLERELTAHVSNIETLDPPPERVVGALTTGEFSWGTFMRTLGAYSEFFGAKTIAGRDVAQMIAKMAQIELGRGGKSWTQLSAAMALQSFGTDLRRNVLWQSLSPEGKQSYRALIDIGRFYDSKTRSLIDLPENYFGVAARIAAIAFELGLDRDRSFLNELLSRAAGQFVDGALFADDALPTGRYDRYSNEYARAMYEAAKVTGREDIINAVAPSIAEQMRLWWDLISVDGYGYPWGRSLGVISYIDTMEIAAFLGKWPEFRPAPLPQLAAAYFAAWVWLRNDFNDQTHLLRVFDFGRGEYDYITKEREWQQTAIFFGKVIGAQKSLMEALEKEGVNNFPSRPNLGKVARFQYFRNGPGRVFGVWVVRQRRLHFGLPFVTGPIAATSDYAPAPHGLSGFAAPVQRIYACLVPFIELDDGTTIAAADGADEICPSADGLAITAKCKHWVIPGAKAGETVDRGLATEITWSIFGESLRRSEVITVSSDVKVRRIWMAVPSRADHLETFYANGLRTDRLISKEGVLDVRILHSDWPIEISALAPGDGQLGKGARGALPLHLVTQTTPAFSHAPLWPLKWEIEISCAHPLQKAVESSAPAEGFSC